jgi:hypothetical protein
VKGKTRRFEEKEAGAIGVFGVGESFCLQTNGEMVRRIVCRGKWREEKSFGILSFRAAGSVYGKRQTML